MSAGMMADFRTQKGQALLELAIFGSLVLLLMWALLNYGLTADYNQRLTMETFRRAVNMTSGGSTSLTAIRDRYIPNPSNPYALGTIAPISASASIVRMHDSENSPSGQNVTTIDVNGTERQFTVASAGNPCDADIISYAFLKAQCSQGSSAWCCSKLDQIFISNGLARTGLQVTGARLTQQATSLDRTETAGEVSTTSGVSWRDTVDREIITVAGQSGAVTRSILSTIPKDEDTITTWTTPSN